ncbi:MAG: 2-methylcitrate dehydratase, partial [Gammaproteobacteria bacterium]|nr:2-methylcitrate dehydratase [Gammaproteobacteria bacterium]
MNGQREYPAKEQSTTPSAVKDDSRRRFLLRSALLAASGVAAPLPATALMARNSSSAHAFDEQEKAQNTPPPPVTRMLADWVVHCTPGSVPADAQKEALRSIVNWLGVAIGGSSEEPVNIALATLLPLSSRGVAIFGRAETLNMPWAALVNGVSSHVLDFDDTDLRTIIHPAGPVAAA